MLIKLDHNEVQGLSAPTHAFAIRESRMAAMGGGGGGSGGGGGVVVGGPTPQAAMYAGLFNVKAAQQAQQAASQSLNDAIASINRQYSQARYDMQPYRTQGVQALNQLNQYIGLDPYNPGAAPTTPTVDSRTIRRYLDQTGVMSMDLKQLETGSPMGLYGSLGTRYQGYVPKNVQLRPNTNIDPSTGKAAKPDYAKGKVLPNEFQVWYNGKNTGMLYYNGKELYNGQKPQAGYWNNNSAYGEGTQGLMNNPYIKDWVTEAITQDPSLDADYEARLEEYKRSLPEWQQNLDWYNEKLAEGPYNSQQVYDKISGQPGFQAELMSGADAINKSASARGYLGSGRLLKELTSFGQGTLSKYYNTELDRLSNLAGMGAQAASNSGQLATNLGNNMASLYSNYGDTKANAALSSGNSLAQALLAANQQYQVIGGGDGGGGGGGMGGLGSVLGGIGSIASMFSSKKLKKKVKTPSGKDILKSVKSLDIDVWSYKKVPNRKHIGPYAEDIQKKFGVGDGTKINIIDMIGILLGSTKEMAKELDELKARNV